MAFDSQRFLAARFCRMAAAFLLAGCLTVAGCAGGRGAPDPALSQAARELAAGMAVPAAPGTGILFHDSEEQQVPPRVRRVASIRRGGVAGASSLSSGAAAAAEQAGVVASGRQTARAAALPSIPVPRNIAGPAVSQGHLRAVTGPAGALPALPSVLPGEAAGLDAAAALPSEPAGAPLLVLRSPVPALWRRLALEAQDIFGLDAALVLAVIRAESSFNATAVSSAGAEGAMQIMPRTQEELGLIDPFDPRANVYAGAQYLMEQLQRFGSVELALAAYNAGPASVERYGGIPPYAETREYVRRVLAYWAAGRQEAGMAGGADRPPDAPAAR